MRTVFGAVSRIIPGILLCVLWSQSNGILLVEQKIREAPEINKLRTIKAIL